MEHGRRNQRNNKYIKSLKYKLSGVYRITCKTSGRFYIGSAMDIKHRLVSHLSVLRLNKHDNKFLQRTYNKYGEDNLELSIEHLCPPEYRILLEQKCIDSLKPKLNINLIASLPPNQKGKKRNQTEEHKENIRKYQSNRTPEHKENLKKSIRSYCEKKFNSNFDDMIPFIEEFLFKNNISMRFFCEKKEIPRSMFIKKVVLYCKNNNINYSDIIKNRKSKKHKINFHFEVNYIKQKNNVINFINSDKNYSKFCIENNIHKHNFKKYLIKYCEENNLDYNKVMIKK